MGWGCRLKCLIRIDEGEEEGKKSGAEFVVENL